LKWGDKLENGKGVVADADPPRTMPLPDYNVAGDQSCTFICNSGTLLDRPTDRHPRRGTNARSYGHDALS
jgi:hypothetical protein